MVRHVCQGDFFLVDGADAGCAIAGSARLDVMVTVCLKFAN
jgi:hypothetical protein